jgi:hypothetical protein
MAQRKAHSRFRLSSGVADFAVRRHAPENTKPRMNSAVTILRITDSGCDQRSQAIAEPIKNEANITANAPIAPRWLGGAGGDGISSNIAMPVYPIVGVGDEEDSAIVDVTRRGC